MKRTHLLAVLVGVAAMGLFAADASAMYHAGMGAFMQRDPGAGGAMRIGAGGPAVGGGFIPRDQYADGMNLYQYVQSKPITNRDPSGLITWQVNETTCEINAIASVKPMWVGDWTDARKAAFEKDLAKAIEDRFNQDTYKIIPKNKNYKTAGGKVKPCPCPNGFKPTVTVIFYENTLAFTLAFPDWQPTIRSNPSTDYQRSWTFGSLGGINEGGATYYEKAPGVFQQPAVHEFGHMLGLGHPGDGIWGADVYTLQGKDFWGRNVDGLVDLMGCGMGLRPFYYDKWKDHLNSEYTHWFCGCGYETK